MAWYIGCMFSLISFLKIEPHLIYNVGLIFVVINVFPFIYIYSFLYFSIMIYHRILNLVPCVIQLGLVHPFCMLVYMRLPQTLNPSCLPLPLISSSMISVLVSSLMKFLLVFPPYETFWFLPICMTFFVEAQKFDQNLSSCGCSSSFLVSTEPI